MSSALPNSASQNSASANSASANSASADSPSQPSEAQISGLNMRQLLLGVNVAIAALVLGKTLLDPNIGQPRPFELPETVELSQWTLTNSEELEPFTLNTGEADYADEGQRYTYVLNTNAASSPAAVATLTVEQRYMIDTNGFIERLLMGHKAFQEDLAVLDEKGGDTSTVDADVQYKLGLGYSGLFQVGETTYLSACVNPRGESTFFIDHFLHNQSIYDRDPTRLFSVLFGRQAWTDQRCLWTHMALSPGASGVELSDSSTLPSQDLQVLLNDTWEEWHDMWQPQFPKR